MSFYVYILTSRRNGTLYIGSTDDLREIGTLAHSIPGITPKTHELGANPPRH